LDRPLLVFDHIPKTAGTTFRRSYLIAALPPEQRWILAGGPRNERDRERFLALGAAARARIRIVAGHDAEALRPHLPGARFVTVVRDPIDRTISSYLHARFHDDGGNLWPDVREKGLSLGQFAQQYIPPNAQSRAVLGEDFASLDDDGVRRRLQARYALVGYTEAFDEFVYLLHASEGLPLCVYQNRLVRAERQNYSPAGDDLEIVKRMHEIDATVHRLVKEEFQARIEALPEATRERMREFLESLKTFRATVSDA